MTSAHAQHDVLRQFSLTGKRALVTGAGRGIGQQLALGLAGAGAEVAISARSVDQLSETEGAIRATGGSARSVPADLSDPGGIVDLVESVELALGGCIDVVVHCAGTQHREAAAAFPHEAWDRLLQVNLSAPFFLSQEIGRRQLEFALPGSHIFVTSLTAILGLPNLVAYNAAKSGLMGVVRALSREWSEHGIRVNAISPGYVETAMTKELLAEPEKRQKLLDRIPMGRFGAPEELAAPTVFLASDAATYMTGQMLTIDGGWSGA